MLTTSGEWSQPMKQSKETDKQISLQRALKSIQDKIEYYIDEVTTIQEQLQAKESKISELLSREKQLLSEIEGTVM